MGFRFEITDRSIQSGLRRIASEQTEAMLRTPGIPDRDIAATLHDLRRRARKLRGLLRLVRPGLPAYKSENAILRDAARQLSHRRDAMVMIETYDSLTDHFASEIDRTAFGPLRAGLTRRVQSLSGDPREEMSEYLEVMTQLHERCRCWKIDGKGRKVLEAGLRLNLDQARDALRAVEAEPSPDALHALRKRAKDHRSQMRLLRPVWTNMMSARADEANRLSDLLGHHHDLAVLSFQIRSEDLLKSEGARSAFLGLATRRQTEIEAEALPLARRLFGVSPKKRAARLMQMWRLWRRETASQR